MRDRARRAGADDSRLPMGPADSGRVVWIDAVRGTAILLLLVWHAAAVPALAGLPVPDLVREANAFFLPYRMPTLMLLSGMLLAQSLSKPLARYYAGKFAMIAWPYVVWVLVAKATFLDVDGMPWWHWRAWYATSYLWFLFFIGVYYLIAPVFARVGPWVPIMIAAGAGLVLPHGSIEQRLAYFGIFFFVGSWLVHRQWAILGVVRRPGVMIAAAGAAVAFGVATALWTDAVQYSVLGAPLSILGAIVLMAAATRLRPEGRVARTTAFVGRSSLVFYVSHYPVMAALTASGWITNVFVLAGTNLLLALVVGVVLSRLRDVLPFAWLFRAPRALTAMVTRVLSLVPRFRSPVRVQAVGGAVVPGSTG